MRLARLRRNLSQEELAERMGVSRSSVVMLERGASGVAIGILLKACTLFGLWRDRLGEILANDPMGEELELATGRKRSRTRDGVADF